MHEACLLFSQHPSYWSRSGDKCDWVVPTPLTHRCVFVCVFVCECVHASTAVAMSYIVILYYMYRLYSFSFLSIDDPNSFFYFLFLQLHSQTLNLLFARDEGRDTCLGYSRNRALLTSYRSNFYFDFGSIGRTCFSILLYLLYYLLVSTFHFINKN